MASRMSRGSTAAAKHEAVPESVGTRQFTNKLNALYRESWRLMLAASEADRAGDQQRAQKELAALHNALGRFLAQE